MEDLRRFNIEQFEVVPMRIDNILHENANAIDERGNTVLHLCVLGNELNPEIMQSFLKRGTNLERKNRSGKTAFLLAVVQRQRKMVESFIENGANVNAYDNMLNNALHYITLPELNFHFKNFPRQGFDFKDTYLILEKLLKEGVDVDHFNRYQDTPLMWAARGNHLDTVKMLLAAGAKVYLENDHRETCLHFATLYDQGDIHSLKRWEENNTAVVSELVRNNACVNCFDREGKTALGYIFQSRHANRDNFGCELIKVGALVNWRNEIEFYLTPVRVLTLRGIQWTLRNHADKCYGEIEWMKDKQLPGVSNLCQFALRGLAEDERNDEHAIYGEVLKLLFNAELPIYFDDIFSKVPKMYLCGRASELIIRARGKSMVALNSYTILEISKNLRNIDLFKLLQASMIVEKSN